MLAASKTLRWKNRRFVGLFNFSSKNFRQLTYFLASILFYILSGHIGFARANIPDKFATNLFREGI
jgi:hypothetical protein